MFLGKTMILIVNKVEVLDMSWHRSDLEGFSFNDCIKYSSEQTEDKNITKRQSTKQDIQLGYWLAAALDDETVCKEMKDDINKWFDSFDSFDLEK